MDESFVQEFTSKFENDGYLLMKGNIPIDIIENGRDESLNAWKSLLLQVKKRSGKELGLSQKGGYREIVQRHTGRYEFRYGQRMYELEDAVKNSLAFQVARTILGNDFAIIGKSCIVADVDCQEQSWHIDGAHISTSKHESCHCLNIFTPLVHLEAGGGTEFRPGSHYLTRDLKRQFLLAKIHKTLRPPLVPTLQLGDSILFDYRILHRGTKNSTGAPRPVFVITLAKPWFKDILNFPSRSIFESPPNEDDE